MEVMVHLHTTEYTKKPKGKVVGDISTDIVKKVTKISIPDLADVVGNHGMTFTPAVLSGGQRLSKNFYSQIVFAVDFDGGWTINSFMEQIKVYGLEPAFVYYTLGRNEVKEKFRAVFIHESTIYDPVAATILRYLLISLFPGADKACSDAARMFFGGSGLVYLNEDARINIAEVSRVIGAMLYSSDANNLSRNMKSLVDEIEEAIDKNCDKRFRIKIIKNTLQIHCLEDRNQIEEKKTVTNNIILEDENNSSKVYIIEKEDSIARSTQDYHADKRKNNNTDPSFKLETVAGQTLETVMVSCPLFRDLYYDDLPHTLEYKLATNLAYVRKGKDIFLQAITGKSDPKIWAYQFKYIKTNNYHPEHCKGGKETCPYWKECKCITLFDKLSRKIIPVEAEPVYAKLDDSYEALAQAMRSYLEAPAKGIYLLKAQTALGKTSCYCQIAKEWNNTKPLMIVVPTIKLQREVLDKLRCMGVEAYETVHLEESLEKMGMDELIEQIQEFYEQGLNDKVKPAVRKYLKENEAILEEYQKKVLNDYLQNIRKMDGSRCVVTTHMMFLHLPQQVLERYEIIIDEDILATVFKGTGSIRYSDLYKVIQTKKISPKAIGRIGEILGQEEETVGDTDMQKYVEEARDWVYSGYAELHDSLINFFKSSTYKIDQKGEKVDYLAVKDLPDVKMVIVSATLNETLYKDFCKYRSIFYQKIPVVQYEGKLKQYTAHSMSRSCIDRIGIERVQRSIEKITGNPDIRTICFKKYDEEAEIYFGKAEGFNDYEGQDVAIIGTPHYPSVVYELIGRYFGYNCNDVLSIRQVVHNGFRFNIMTYKDEKMRNLQFYLMESELEQAVGRARLLRHNSTVYLFSNFPCRQAELVQDEYIESENGKD